MRDITSRCLKIARSAVPLRDTRVLSGALTSCAGKRALSETFRHDGGARYDIYSAADSMSAREHMRIDSAYARVRAQARGVSARDACATRGALKEH